jgi:hypothetical protein
VLWEAWEHGTKEIAGDTLLQAAGSTADRLPLVFRNSAAWGTMIAKGIRKGTYCLKKPAGE